MGIIFFGSGPVAAKSLELLAQNFDIEAVVTKPKPEHHRGDFPVIDVATKFGLPLHTVGNKTELSELILKKPFSSKIGVLIDFGIIVSQDVIDYFPLGIVNSHFSLLPELRGADPITFSILNGQKETGVSLMLLVEAMDEGPLLAQVPYEMPSDITTPGLTDALIELSDHAMKEILPLYIQGKVEPMAQQGTATYSRKLTKQDGAIDWNKPAEQIEREVRAYIDWPKSTTKIAGKEVIVTKAHVMPVSPYDPVPGHVTIANGMLSVACAKDALAIDQLKPAGKKEMTAADFIRGYSHPI